MTRIRISTEDVLRRDKLDLSLLCVVYTVVGLNINTAQLAEVTCIVIYYCFIYIYFFSFSTCNSL